MRSLPAASRPRSAYSSGTFARRPGPVSNVRVFGSTARGTDRADSDIDLLVSAAEPIGLLKQSRVQERDLRPLGIPTDLVFDDAIGPDLAARILAEAIPL